MLLDPADVAQLVPDVYAEFRPIVVDALTFFLRHLSPERLQPILQEQMTLPADADIGRRIARFMHHCPALHKLGQVIARHRALEPGFRQRLQHLETMEPRTPLDQLRPILNTELGPAISRHKIKLGKAPLAEASVAVVVPFTWQEPNHFHPRRDGVFKILKPGIIQKLQEDLDILAKLSDHLDIERRKGHLPDVEYRDTFDDIRELLTHEIDFRNEQNNLRAARHRFANQPDILIPEVFPFSTEHITAMERVYGVKVTSLEHPTQFQRRLLADTIARSILADVIFSRADNTPFHADPHAGNMIATDDGRLAILDWSLTDHLNHHDQIQITQILVGALLRDTSRIERAIHALAMNDADHAIIRRFTRDALRQLPGIGWLMRLMDRLAGSGIRFPPHLLLFRKTYFTLEGVIEDVSPSCSLEKILTRQTISQFLWEWPLRLLRPFDSRNFGTHLSNSDLLEIALALHSRTAKAWLPFFLPPTAPCLQPTLHTNTV